MCSCNLITEGNSPTLYFNESARRFETINKLPDEETSKYYFPNWSANLLN